MGDLGIEEGESEMNDWTKKRDTTSAADMRALVLAPLIKFQWCPGSYWLTTRMANCLSIQFGRVGILIRMPWKLEAEYSEGWDAGWRAGRAK